MQAEWSVGILSLPGAVFRVGPCPPVPQFGDLILQFLDLAFEVADSLPEFGGGVVAAWCAAGDFFEALADQGGVGVAARPGGGFEFWVQFEAGRLRCHSVRVVRG